VLAIAVTLAMALPIFVLRSIPTYSTKIRKSSHDNHNEFLLV